MNAVFPAGSSDALDSGALQVELCEGDIAVVKLIGEHDLCDSHALAVALRSASERAGVLIDLSECTYFELSVAGRLIATRNRMRARGGRLEVYVPPEASAAWPIVRRTGLAAALTVHATRTAGLASLARARDEVVPCRQRVSWLHRSSPSRS